MTEESAGIPRSRSLASPCLRNVVDSDSRMQVSILMVRALLDVTERAGGSRERFLSVAGLDPSQLADGDARLSLEAYERVLRAALEASGDPAFGIRMGKHASLVMFDVIGPLSEHASTLRHAIESIVRYSRLLAAGYEPQLLEAETTALLRFSPLRGDAPTARLTTEFVMTALWRTLPKTLSDVAEMNVFFAHSAPEYLAEYEHVFGDAAHFGCAFTEIAFPRTWLDRERPYQRPDLYALLETQAERTLGRLERDVALSERIQQLLAAHDQRSVPTMDDAARALHVSVRSLRRRLREEGVSYDALVERSRMTTAKRLLERPGATIQQTAFAMGFATPVAFHRAFKRWTGMTPKQYLRSF
jgi:AraC-like DNA-binding protein